MRAWAQSAFANAFFIIPNMLLFLYISHNRVCVCTEPTCERAILSLETKPTHTHNISYYQNI